LRGWSGEREKVLLKDNHKEGKRDDSRDSGKSRSYAQQRCDACFVRMYDNINIIAVCSFIDYLFKNDMVAGLTEGGSF